MPDSSSNEESLIGALRHDLRTPINQIIGYAELVSEDLEGDQHAGTREDLAKIGRAARGLAELITREIQPGRIALVGGQEEKTGAGDAPATEDKSSGRLGQPSLPGDEVILLAGETAKILIVDDQ